MAVKYSQLILKGLKPSSPTILAIPTGETNETDEKKEQNNELLRYSFCYSTRLFLIK